MSEVVDKVSYSEAAHYLDRYLALKGTDYAVMIDGPWGSGKTYFLKTYLDARNASVTKADILSTRGRYWYASLAGVNNVGQVYEQFFVSEHGKSSKIATEIALRVSAFYSKKTVGTPEDAAKIRRAMLDPRYRVIVFDDLERSGMPVLEALALVNSFAKDGVKVIVVAHDDEIVKRERKNHAGHADEDTDRPDYERQKEKFIGKTIRVGSVVEDVLSNFVERMTCATAKASAERAKDKIVTVFLASKTENLRSLRQALEDFDHLIAVLDNALKEYPVATDAILLQLLAVELEFRSSTNGMSYEGIRDLRFTPLKGLFGKKPEDTETRLLETYPMISWNDPVVPYVHFAKLLKAGAISREQLEKRVISHPLISPADNVDPWRAIWDWTSLTKTEYLGFRNQLVEQLMKRQIEHPGELLHAIGEVLTLATFGDDLIDGASPKVYFKDYIDDVVKAHTLQPISDLFGKVSRAHAGLVYPSNDTPQFKEIESLVREGVAKVRDANLREMLPKFFDDLRLDQSIALRLNRYGEKEDNLKGVPFLHHSDPDQFAELLVEDAAPRETVISAFLDRYSNDAHDKLLELEYDWLEKVEKAFAKIVRREPPPYKRLLELRQGWIKTELDKHLGRAGAVAVPPAK